MRRAGPLQPSVWRKLSQGLFVLAFLALFIHTDSNGGDELPWAVNLLFRLDPFLALTAMLAAKTVIVLMLPAVVTIGLTLVCGRLFCGWVCPLGTLIDASRRLVGHRHASPARPERHRPKYLLLVFFLAAAWFGLPLAGFVDPFSLLVRALTFAVHPGLDHAATTLFTWTYQQAPEWVNTLTEPVYGLLKRYLLPFTDKVYTLSVFSLMLLLAVLGLSRVNSRFFCRTICPLGALLGLVSRLAPLRLGGGSPVCGQCHHCRDICPMAAIDEARAINPAECTLCLDCLGECPRARIGFAWKAAGARAPRIDLSRRAVIGSLAAGALAPLALPSRPLARHADPLLIRPPGALAEEAFLGRCVRCGECMKVCIGNALHAAWLEAGLEGMFSPRLIGRIGYCEYNCTLCGQVCPTGAIRRLSRSEKQGTVIGRAHFDKNRCLPYASATPCIVCEEHCPTPDKAIKFREVEVENSRGERAWVRQPYVVDNLCIGCGICEHKCPVSGAAAVLVTSAGESRHAQAVFVNGY
ncbi:4Fe-4S ferredoxin iron-sulfur binding domain-containing protein [Desulfobulbus propionicus DSM 2032]|jgi:polyferredoxin|uniref:4Fe-4S ferredoxin iron-sulfur binding domain-containing protein n=1 Tax=Desulfobulbus propionicus (strain ATCC 33891 / DSM 2032 / VKM B-1956 / 1pr3) TaxID=577650 RepID=A0A7U3YMS2_DESPD|nr:4Fe-4S binding protein [Desulfobulbus propionicus]ADW18254.1 4Fe-4S ferredoxin iron-sulfur binding domain-containing protein [Desulfobulbus propionicus DSM 2032]